MKNKIEVLSIDGKKAKEIESPEFFSHQVREDIISKVLEAKKIFHPHSPSPVAGKQHSASGKIRHRRRKWRTAYGKGISRIPRKIMTRRGSQFNWVGAEVSSTRGGRRAHPPKIIAMINTSKINKKEMRIAFLSALSATTKEEIVKKKYSSLNEEKLKGLPFVFESKITSLKIKSLLENLKKVLGEKIFDVGIKEKKVRAGKGKMRGRTYKKSAGLLFVVGNNEKIKTKLFDVRIAKDLRIEDLANGGAGRIVVYTEEAIKNLEEKFGGKRKWLA